MKIRVEEGVSNFKQGQEKVREKKGVKLSTKVGDNQHTTNLWNLKTSPFMRGRGLFAGLFPLL